jgi:hypothetical protein
MHLALKTNKHCVTRRVSKKKAAANHCPSRKFSSAGDKRWDKNRQGISTIDKRYSTHSKD